ncbi:hypothetical protein [Algoriphagus sp. A40]|uniref:hypothetical protein n=1 Tax=Algoriphagus sp. A40 TaxID=1945863 RepID=UPI00143A3B5E|nr:hypothetical protein [Algoriphagus sp. A40]
MTKTRLDSKIITTAFLPKMTRSRLNGKWMNLAKLKMWGLYFCNPFMALIIY